MITVDVMLPSYGDIMKISCEESLATDTLMEMLRGMLAGYPHPGRSWLCDVDRRHTLKHDCTLGDCGLVDGSSLIII